MLKYFSHVGSRSDSLSHDPLCSFCGTPTTPVSDCFPIHLYLSPRQHFPRFGEVSDFVPLLGEKIHKAPGMILKLISGFPLKREYMHANCMFDMKE